MSDATHMVTMLPAFAFAFAWQDRFFLTACRAGAQAANDARVSAGRSARTSCHRVQFTCALDARQALSLLTHSFSRATYAFERTSRTQRQRAKPVSFLTMTKRRLLDEPFRLWRRRHS